MTRVFRSTEVWTSFRDQELVGKTLGFVPTMGALHSGHQSLVAKSVGENEFTLVSIFVNPTQFNDSKDLEKYPRTFEADLKCLEEVEADFLLYPEYSEIYADSYRYKITESQFSHTLCGAHRPAHFDGVLTVVMKLLQIAGANHAYFGEKDFQQLELIRGMADAFFLRTQIHGLPTLREKDGLAMSSRNTRLSGADREKAPLIYKLIENRQKTVAQIRKELIQNGFEVDYVEELRGRRFVAANLGGVRLIDNVSI